MQGLASMLLVLSLATTCAAAGQPPRGASGMPPGMDCAQVAAMPGSPITREACEQMMGAQQAYQQAASDPGAARPGDEAMGCDAIQAELAQQHFVAPDRDKAAAGKADAEQWQSTVARQQAEVNRIGVAESAAVAAASAHDAAVQAATMGVVNPHTAAAVEQRVQQENRVIGKRMAEERRPTETRMMNNTAGIAGDLGQQMRDNPRLARLMQLADAKHCGRSR